MNKQMKKRKLVRDHVVLLTNIFKDFSGCPRSHHFTVLACTSFSATISFINLKPLFILILVNTAIL